MGGFGYICVEVVLPVCNTTVKISVKHPMGGDRELGEVVDGAEVQLYYLYLLPFCGLKVIIGSFSTL